MENRGLKFILIIAGLWLASDIVAQVLSYSPGPGSYITVTGTSTLHDWEMVSENIRSVAVFNTNGEGSPESVESVTFRLAANTLKSDKSGLDKRAYDALDVKRHPEIIFSTNGSGNLQKSGEKFQVNSTGELTVAGVTRQVNVNAVCINGDDERLVCSGTTRLKMSDFQIDPPVMMLGALRTGDEVTIKYNIVYTK